MLMMIGGGGETVLDWGYWGGCGGRGRWGQGLVGGRAGGRCAGGMKGCWVGRVRCGSICLKSKGCSAVGGGT